MPATKKYLDEEGLSILVTNVKKYINVKLNAIISKGEENAIISKVDENDSIAIGSHASATGMRSVALGAYSQTSEYDTVSVGCPEISVPGELFNEIVQEEINRRIIHVADGIDDNDAATVGQLKDIGNIFSDDGHLVLPNGIEIY